MSLRWFVSRTRKYPFGASAIEPQELLDQGLEICPGDQWGGGHAVANLHRVFTLPEGAALLSRQNMSGQAHHG